MRDSRGDRALIWLLQVADPANIGAFFTQFQLDMATTALEIVAAFAMRRPRPPCGAASRHIGSKGVDCAGEKEVASLLPWPDCSAIRHIEPGNWGRGTAIGHHFA